MMGKYSVIPEYRADYLDYLLERVGSKSFPLERQYWRVYRDLFETIFVVVHAKDVNRVGDVEDIRQHYSDEIGIDWHFFLSDSVSVLEILVSIAIRMEDIMHESELGDRTGVWFLQLLDNLGLGVYSDDCITTDYASDFDTIMSIFIYRKYDRNGKYGGLFPLKRAAKDQRKAELWYQMNTYLLEKFYCDVE